MDFKKIEFYKLNGHAVEPVDDLIEWGNIMKQTNRHVAETFIEGNRISTIFLGIDHNYSGYGPPILFETMVFIEGEGEWQERCSTWDEAEKMHEAMCQKVRNHLIAAGMVANQIIDSFFKINHQ
jgi:hypothetical protein